MTVDKISLRQLNRATLARQMLLERETASVSEAVKRLFGMQAQEPRPPFVGLWTRLTSFNIDALRAALRDRNIVRATMMRGTLHLVTTRDYLEFRSVLQPMLTQGMRVLGERAEGLELEQLIPVARDLLHDCPRTFDELRMLLRDVFPHVNDRAMGYAVRLHIPLVMVPTADRWAYPAVAAFTPAETWIGQPLSRDISTEMLIHRYLSAFGPATASDAQTWSGLTGLTSTLRSMRSQLREFRDDRGRELFDVVDGARPDADVPAPVRFLPEFDNLLLAHADRTRVIADEHRGMVVTKNLRVHATFLVDGFVAGIWRIERKKASATMRMTPFTPLTDQVKNALSSEGERLLRFVEADASQFDIHFEASTLVG